jgi:hypothetical protein
MRVVVLALLLACRKEPAPVAAADAGSLGDPNNPMFGPPGTPFGPSVALPLDWPSDVPLYPNAHLLQASAQTTDAGKRWDAQYDVSDSAQRVTEFHRKAFAGTETFDMNLSLGRMIQFTTPDRVIGVTIFEIQRQTHVVVSVQPP